ncbi:MOSC domain-containing protein [Colletotrichum higginsianum IMI 349063]|uniref:MOSC domain-containing protein n=1 Tax=Colletotrichum higginsianum (strain IMI 349063) TaxID=759273 RepID=A0A1B7XXG2_COLHI|nr:MOSC domain-containing protein [Colletotrichum higginsianum IMI 349063]OBR04448.1 MOSC domain-containing protein [Colletotrichum higginsianum IMI 349063]
MDALTNTTLTEVHVATNPLTTVNAAVVLVVATVTALLFGVRLFRSQAAGDALEISQDQTETIVVIRRKQLYVYPVKGLRGCELQEARVGQHGFVGDRTFSLQKVHRDENDPSEKTYETLLIGRCLQLALFETSVHNVSNEVAVKWHDRETEFDKRAADAKVDTDDEIRFPLSPGLEGLEECEVSLHVSRTKAYDMGDGPASWFSDRLGFETRLVYIGDGSRAVLGSLAPNSRGGLKKAKWTSRLRALVPSLAFREERLVFNDLGHYLVVTEASNSQVSSRLEGGAEMDVRKFRPNIVVKGASAPFAEDFWGELTFEGGVRMPLTSNCYRCQSITVDYDTGKAAADDRGSVWKKLNKDRRVDKGAKYSPVFGRYGFCFGSAVGKTLTVGERARVTVVNPARTTFDWPHLTTFGLGQTEK